MYRCVDGHWPPSPTCIPLSEISLGKSWYHLPGGFSRSLSPRPGIAQLRSAAKAEADSKRNDGSAKAQARAGGEAADADKELRILSRIVQLDASGLSYDAGPRHVELLIRALDLPDNIIACGAWIQRCRHRQP